MDRKPKFLMEKQLDKSNIHPVRISLLTRLMGWVIALILGLSASLHLASTSNTPGTATIIAFHAATAAAYLAVFSHCLMRFAYSRWSSWLLYTAGFGCLMVARIGGLLNGFNVIEDVFLRDHLDLLWFALTPAATVLLLAGAHTSRDKINNRGIGLWRGSLRLVTVLTAALLVWEFGVGELLCAQMSAMHISPRLVVGALSAVAVLALLHRTYLLESTAHDEIVTPLCYWSVATVMGSALAMAIWNESQAPWWQVQGLEFAGTAALLIGLSRVNERAHRESAVHMSDLEAMQKISWSLVGAPDLSELSRAFARAVAEGFGASCVAVYLQGNSSDEMVVAATNGIDDPSVFVGKMCSLRPERRPGFHNGHTSRAYSSGEVQTVSETFSDVEFLPWQVVAREAGVVVSVPLPHADAVIGVVDIFVPGIQTIPTERVKLLEAVAAAVSPAIENARTRDESSDEILRAA